MTSFTFPALLAATVLALASVLLQRRHERASDVCIVLSYVIVGVVLIMTRFLP